MSQFFTSLQKQPAALVAAGAALGGGVALLAAHLTAGWCPFVPGSGRGLKQDGGASDRVCPMTGRRGTCPSSSAQKKKPMIVTVTGAAGQIGYAILFQIAQGRMLGPDQPIELRLLEIPNCLPLLDGVVMELEDCAFPLLEKIVPTADLKTAFQDCDVALLIGARPRGPGMSRADLLLANGNIFREQGQALDKYASRNVKVLVVGNPVLVNCKIAMDNAPSLPKTAFSAMSKLDELRAIAQLAKKAGCTAGDISNVIVWGNHSDTMYPDITFAKIKGRPALDVVNDEQWLQQFARTVQKRGAAIIEARKHSSAASAANAAVEHVRAWVLGTAPGQYVSMAVCSNGEYDIPAGLIYSFPVTCHNGEYKIVTGLESQLTPAARDKLKASADELVQEDQAYQRATANQPGAAAAAAAGTTSTSASADTTTTSSAAATEEDKSEKPTKSRKSRS